MSRFLAVSPPRGGVILILRDLVKGAADVSSPSLPERASAFECARQSPSSSQRSEYERNCLVQVLLKGPESAT